MKKHFQHVVYVNPACRCAKTTCHFAHAQTSNGSEPIKRFFLGSRSIILEGKTVYWIGFPGAHGSIAPNRNSGAR
jgi:hypothetical protein